MQNLLGEWHLKHTFPGKNMIRYLSWILLLNMIVAVEVESKKKTKFTVTGIVLGEDGEGLKKVKLSLMNEDGKKVDKDKTGGDGEFKFKKISAGSYVLKGIHKKEGEAEINLTVTMKDVDLTLKIPTDEILELPVLTDKEISISPEMDMLPQQRKEAGKQKLKFEDLFFEYESNLKALETEIDSLKSVVKGYEKGQTMPNVSRDILDLIKVPDYQHRVELQNGTVVSGELLEESDSTLTLKTQIGTLVLKKEMVVRMDELEKPGPKVVFLGDPFIDYYPDMQVFSGRVKNVGEIRADFVRVIGNLFDQTTKNTGSDSIFVKGTRIAYESNVVADTALEPDQTASYMLVVPLVKGQKAQYHTMDIHWEKTK